MLPDAPLAYRAGVEPMPNHRDGVWLTSVWERARAQATGSPGGFILALDEIQKVPNWAEVVKGLWDADRHADLPLRVVLAGSAPLLMQQGLTESLAGRFETIRLAHWAYSEMAQAFGFDLPRYVYFGGYPGVADHDERRWRDYVRDALIAPNIERDILAMQRIEKPVLLKQLFELGTETLGGRFWPTTRCWAASRTPATRRRWRATSACFGKPDCWLGLTNTAGRGCAGALRRRSGSRSTWR